MSKAARTAFRIRLHHRRRLQGEKKRQRLKEAQRESRMRMRLSASCECLRQSLTPRWKRCQRMREQCCCGQFPFSPYLSPKLATGGLSVQQSQWGKSAQKSDIVAWTRAKSIVAKAVAAETDSTPYERRIATIRKLSEALCVRLHVTQSFKRSASEKKEKQPKHLFTLKKLREHVGKDHVREVVCMALFAPAYLAASSAHRSLLLPNATKTVHLILQLPRYAPTWIR